MDRIPGLKEEDWELAETVEQFTEKYLLDRYDEPAPIPSVHREWWALFLSEYKYVSIAAPRKHAKSTALTFAFALYLLAMKTRRHILLIGANEELAADFLKDIKIELLENEELAAFCGFVKFRKDTDSEIIIQYKSGGRARMLAKGAGQRMRGLKWERKRPDMIIFDDMEYEELVGSDFRKKKFGDWFMGTVVPLFSQTGQIRGVGTIIAFDSFLASTMPDEKKKTTVIEPLRTYSTAIKPGTWFGVKYRAHDPVFENILWREKYDKNWFVEERNFYASDGRLGVYGQEYLNNPIDEETAYFRKTDFLPMTEGDLKTKKTYYAAADLAIGETERSAYTAIVVGGLDAEGVLHIVDVRRGRWDGKEISNEMSSVQLAWEPDVFKVESENIAKSLGSFIYSEMGTAPDKPFINIDATAPTKDKDKRGRGIQARTRSRSVKFDKEAEWYPDFEEELLKYPKYPYKDQFDAFAWLGLMLDEMIGPPTSEEIEEEEYQEAFEQHMPMGRNGTTGY